MIEVRIDTSRLDATLAEHTNRLQDSAPLMSNVAALLESMTQQAFIDEGPGWQDLAESTKAQRTKMGYWPGKMLDISTAGLKSSVYGDSGNGWASIGAGSGKSAAYAAIHQFGGQAGRGKRTTIPARPYMPLSEDGESLTPDAEASLVELALAYLENG